MNISEDGNEQVAEPVIDETVPAPDPESTAAPDDPEPSPDEPTEGAPKTFTQEELDAILEKRLAKERRKMERAQQVKPAETPDIYDGDGLLKTPEEIIAEHEQQKVQQEIHAKYVEREEAALEKYDDFEQVAYNRELPVTDTMALAIRADENGPDILYHLGSNPRESARIARLPDFQQAIEIGKISVKVAANPPARKTTNAPAPISPVTPQGNGSPVFDTTDPRSIKTMSTSEWIEADRRRQIAKLERKQRA